MGKGIRWTKADIEGMPKRIREQIESQMESAPKKKNKFNAKKTEYNGKIYDSKAEANYAAILDIRKKAGEIKKIIPQFPIDLYSEGVFITRYYIDFKIEKEEGNEYIEVKGKETSTWKIKWKMAIEALKKLDPGCELVLVKKGIETKRIQL